MKEKALKRISGVFLSCVMAITALPCGMFEPVREVCAAEPTNNDDFTTIFIESSNYSDFFRYIEADGNYRIVLHVDIDERIGSEGDVNSPYVWYWKTFGQGVKEIELLGHDIDLKNDRIRKASEEEYMYMFNVPEGAKVVINDRYDSGTIHYDGTLREGSSYSRSHYLEQRSIFGVSGELTVNAGNIIAGRVNKGGNGASGYYKRQINGNGIFVDAGGRLNINGGTIAGRGFKPDRRTRNSAIRGGNCEIYINDGIFWGNGGADVLTVTDQTDLYIKSGYFNTDDEECVMYSDDDFYDTNYGDIGIPSYAALRYKDYSKVYKKGKEMSVSELLDEDNIRYTSARIEIKPIDRMTYVYYSKGNNFTQASGDLSLEWDKVTPLRFYLFGSDLYFFKMKFYENIKHYSNPNTVYSISDSPFGDAIDPSLENIKIPDSRNTYEKYVTVGTGLLPSAHYIDLKELPSSALDKLQFGKTYYLRISSSEEYSSTHDYNINFVSKGLIKIKIAENNVTMPSLNMGVKYEFDGTTSPNSVTLIPTGDGTAQSLDKLLSKGAATKYEVSYTYYDKSNTRRTHTVSSDSGSNLQIQINDIRRGASTVTYSVKLYYGSSVLGEKSVSTTVVYVPNMTTSPEATNGRVLVKAGTSVTLSNDSSLTTGVFYSKNGTKVSMGKASYTITDVGADQGIYSIGYTYNGTDYPSGKAVYIGLNDTGDRQLGLGVSSTTCTITKDTDATPTFTAKATGTDWGTMKYYYWYIESVPSDLEDTGLTVIQRKKTTTTDKTVSITLGELFSVTNHSTIFTEGKYVIRCEATNTAGQKVSSQTATVTVKRPPTDMQLLWNNNDIAGSGVAFESENGTLTVTPKLVPDNSTNTSGITFTSLDPDKATVTPNGVLTAKHYGKTTIVAVCNSTSISKSFDVYVPRTEYSVNIPEDYLEAEVGKVPYQGVISTSDGYTAQLKWAYYYSSGVGSNLPANEPFKGENSYVPFVEIYPDKGTAYPSEYNTQINAYFYKDSDIDITVNGQTYYGAGRLYTNSDYTYGLPVSQGNSSEDRIKLYLPHTDVLIDPHDEYMDEINIDFTVPNAGDVPVEENYICLGDNVAIKSDNIKLISDSIKEVTDVSTTYDNINSNDACTDFNGTFEAGKTYRYYMFLIISDNAQSADGGKVYLADNVNINVSNAARYSASNERTYAQICVYFKPNGDYAILRGDVDLDGDVDNTDAALVLKYINGTINLTMSQKTAARSADGNTEIDMRDAIAILKNKTV